MWTNITFLLADTYTQRVEYYHFLGWYIHTM